MVYNIIRLERIVPMKKPSSEQGSLNAVERITEAALKLFSQNPADTVSLSMIAKEADVKVPLLMYHFKSRSNLYQTIFDRVMASYESIFRPYMEMVEEKKSLTKEEAGGILCMLINNAMDGLYNASSPNRQHERIFIFEILYPSEFRDLFFEKYYRRHIDFFVTVLMAITGNDDRETAIIQTAAILSQIFSFRVERETLLRSVGIVGFSREEAEMMKEIVLRNAFLILESDLEETYLSELRRPCFTMLETAPISQDPRTPPVSPDMQYSDVDMSIASVERIIETGMKLFAEQTAEAVTLSTIAAESGAKVPLIMYHFKSKANLYRIVFERVMSILDQRVRDCRDRWEKQTPHGKDEARAALAELIGVYLDNASSRQVSGKNILIHEMVYPSELYDLFYDKFIRSQHDFLESLVQSITGTTNRPWVCLQTACILGLVFCFRLDKIFTHRPAGNAESDREKADRIKDAVIRYALLTLE